MLSQMTFVCADDGSTLLLLLLLLLNCEYLHEMKLPVLGALYNPHKSTTHVGQDMRPTLRVPSVPEMCPKACEHLQVMIDNQPQGYNFPIDRLLLTIFETCAYNCRTDSI